MRLTDSSNWRRRGGARLALALLVAALGPSDAPAQSRRIATPRPADYLERLAIEVPPATPRTFVYTNKRAAFYAGRTSAENDNPNQGLNVFGRKVLEDYWITVDGAVRARSAASRVEVLPHAVRRTWADGVVETVSLVDGVDAIVVTLAAPAARRFALAPLVAGGSREADFEVAREPEALYVTSRVGGDIAQRTPRTLAVLVAAPARATVERAEPDRAAFVPGRLSGAPARAARFVVAVGSNRDEASRLAGTLRRDAGRLVAARRDRIARFLLDTYVETADPRFDKALAWLKASGDALVTEQAGTGIWAGLYWFNNYWGRDTFISLPGISLVTGRLDDARRILESFAKFQMTDAASPLFGRVPNRVNSPTDIIYNTVDGTPWFVREAYEYVLYSGDLAFATRIYPAVKRATDGTLRHRVDAKGLLVHDDADTWMDAKWEGRVPWSPRGNRAVDVQALWHAQLEASARLAEMTGDAEAAARWRREAARVRAAFRSSYRDPRTGALVDHLNDDGAPDGQVRPNQIFAVTVPFSPLLEPHEQLPVVRQVVEELTYPYGVASLSQRDPSFHPYHRDERWHFDSAYHNGTVWVWNAGPVVEALTRFGRQELAYRLTSSMVDQTLDMGAVGTLSELIDAIPRDGELTLSGTETQAWSIAEFVRVAYQSYLGLRPNVPARTLAIAPALPKALGTVRAIVPFGDERIHLTIAPEGTGYRATAFAARLSTPVKITGGPREVRLMAGREVTWPIPSRFPDGGALADLAFASPEIVPGLKTLEGGPTPVVRLLAADAAVREPAGARVLFEQSDPEGDDRGPEGAYTYPTDAHYEPGILDLLGARIAADEERYYVTLRFRRLVDPGWHPELGFQLTYVALAVDADGVAGSGAVEVGKGAAYRLPDHVGFERIVYVGGGIEIADASGKALATYSPSTRAGAIGDAREAVIRFSVPRAFLGDPTPRMRFAVLVGGQDDSGAAGLGSFRAVAPAASQWAGGGAAGPTPTRVYDALLPR
jgi:glycogen debranching enzyme